MKTWVRKSLKAGVLSAGIILVAGGAAHASTTAGNTGILSGNQAAVPVQIPVLVCGDAVGVLGNAGADCSASAPSASFIGGSMGTTAGNSGLLTGNQLAVPVQVPVSVTGIAAAVGGNALAASHTGAGANRGATASITPNAGGTGVSGFNTGLGTGNQVAVPVQVPIDLCGLAIGALGTAGANCATGTGAAIANGSHAGGTGMTTAGSSGALSGNQVQVPVQVPINICGIAVGALGNAAAGCGNGGSGTGGGGTGSGGNGGGTGSGGYGGGSGSGGYGGGSGSGGSGSGGYGGGSGSGGYGGGSGSGGYGGGSGSGGYGSGSGSGHAATASSVTDLLSAHHAGVARHHARSAAHHTGTEAMTSNAGGVRTMHGTNGALITGNNTGAATGNQVLADVAAPVAVYNIVASVLGTAAL